MRPRTTQDPASWQGGYNAGMSGGSLTCPPEVSDSLAYSSGYIEGKAAKQRAAVARRLSDGKPLNREFRVGYR